MFKWLTSQDVFEIKDEIEEVNRKMLEKLLDENDFVAVYFCKSDVCLFLAIYSFIFLTSYFGSNTQTHRISTPYLRLSVYHRGDLSICVVDLKDIRVH